MSLRYDLRIFNNLEKGTPEVFLGIPGTGKTGRRLLPVKWQNGVRVVVNSFKNWLIIKAPPEVDIRECSLHVGSRVDVDTQCRIKKREWKIRFPYRAARHSESPADINIILAPDEENEPPDPDPGSGTN